MEKWWKKWGNQHMVQGRIHLYQKGLWGYEVKEKKIGNEENQKLCPPTQDQIKSGNSPSVRRDRKKKVPETKKIPYA
jgi:hypothetical protein